MENMKRVNWVNIIKITLNVVFYIFILLLLLLSISWIRVKNNEDIPNVFGYGFLSVTSSSMDGNEDDSFKKGDLIIVKMLDEKGRKDLQVGDIVTFYLNINETDANDFKIRGFNTHRIVEVGSNYVITQGDLVEVRYPNKKYDPNGVNNDPETYETILLDQVKAVHSSTWKGAGSFVASLQKPTGFALIIVLPAFLLLCYQAFILIRHILNVNRIKLEEKHEKEKEEVKKELEKEKELIRAQLIEELKKEQEQKE